MNIKLVKRKKKLKRKQIITFNTAKTKAIALIDYYNFYDSPFHFINLMRASNYFIE